MIVEDNADVLIGDVLSSNLRKTGTGTAKSEVFKGDTNVDVANSNGEWIDIANREGRVFLISE